MPHDERPERPPGPFGPPPDDAWRDGLVQLVVLAAVGGIAAGLIGGLFRLALRRADAARLELLHRAHHHAAIGWIAAAAIVAAAAAIARLIVRWAPEAAGSGVQRVEALVRAEEPPPRARVIPAKFAGGLIAIGGGLALGREGPTVQMGATAGAILSRRGRLGDHDGVTLQAALAGAGLAVAFSAPLGGAVFVFEELAHAFRARLVVATLFAVGPAIAVTHAILGDAPDFRVTGVRSPAAWTLLAFAVLGVALGVLGVLYGRLIVVLLDLNARFGRVAPEVRAGVIGAIVGVVGFASPSIIGGGDPLNQEVLAGGVSIATLLAWMAVRWFLGPLSYAAGAPGGIFAPLLLVGAAGGALFAGVVNAAAPGAGLGAAGFAVAGMAAFFAAVVRAPITALVLVVEMTAAPALVLPMAVCCATATLAAALLGGQPIYDTLRLRTARLERAARAGPGT